jgi:hypothetical protein
VRIGSAIAAALCLVYAAPAAAQPVAPLKIELEYDGVLDALHVTGELKVMTLHVVERAQPTEFQTAAELKSYGLLRALWRIDVATDANGPVDGGLPHPRFFEFTRFEKHGPRRASLVWGAQDVAVTPPPHALGDPPPTRAQKLEAADPVTLFSRAVYATSGQELCARNWRFFDGSEVYELRFQSTGPTELSDEDRARGFTSAVRCAVRYAEVSGFIHKPGDRRDEGLKSDIHAEFGQLGANGPWVFLSLKADTVLGYAKVRLRDLKLEQP